MTKGQHIVWLILKTVERTSFNFVFARSNRKSAHFKTSILAVIVNI